MASDRFERVAKKLFGPGVDLGKLTQGHLNKINKFWNLHAPTAKERAMWKRLGNSKGGRLGLDNSGQKIVQQLYKKGGKV